MNRLKLLILSSIVVVLPGCALWDAYFMAGYDNQEYALVNTIRSTAEVNITACTDANQSKQTFNYIYSKGVELKNFTQYIPNNEDANCLANNIYQLAKQGNEAYNNDAVVSLAFCRLKLQQIVRATETAQKAIGSKPR